MPANVSVEEMRDALRQIEDFCIRYDGELHQEFFKGLFERIRVVTSEPEIDTAQLVRAYQDAIAGLVELSDPPSRETAGEVYEKLVKVVALDQATGPNFHVEIVMKRSPEFEVPYFAGSPLEGDLRSKLPARRPLKPEDKDLLHDFREQLPPSGPLVRDWNGNGNQA